MNSNYDQNTPNVAVLLAAYNGIKWIDDQINSIDLQKEVNLDIYLSIDLSEEQFYKHCKEIQSTFSNIILLPYGQKYGGAAQNFYRLIKDVDLSNYDFIAFSDQDDIWLDKKLVHACKTIQSKKIHAYSSDVVAFWEDGTKRLVKKSYSQKKYDYFFESAGPGCSFVFSEASFAKFKNFMLDNWTKVNKVDNYDWLIYAYFRSNEMKWLIDNTPLLHYRQHDSNQVGFNFGLKAYIRRLKMIKENAYQEEIKKIFSLVSNQNCTEFSLNSVFLIKNILQLRRRPRDTMILFLVIIFRFV
ncbi:glycosyltransferase family 2 protein [Candidatus Pseudothioglobus singularis]|nr:glycosyltransferase family 2 protein [Candidatus Pseudothioglobus singularis]